MVDGRFFVVFNCCVEYDGSQLIKRVHAVYVNPRRRNKRPTSHFPVLGSEKRYKLFNKPMRICFIYFISRVLQNLAGLNTF